MIIQVKNNLANNAPVTYQTYSEVAGTNIIRWKNPDAFSANWALQVGATGADQSEIVLLSSSQPSGTAGTLTANTLYEHPADTALYGINFDKLVFQRSVTGTGGVASPMTNGTVTIQPNSRVTIFDDTSGQLTYAYNSYYLNSITSGSSQVSDWITPVGYTYYSLAKIRQRIRDRLYNSDFIQNDATIDNWVNEWLQMMHNAQVDVNEDYGLGTMGIAYPSNTELGTITVTDFRGGLKRAWWVDASGTYQATKMDSNTFNPQRIFNNTAPYYYMQGDLVIGRKPPDGAGTLVCEYYKQTPMLANDTDEIPVPMQSFTKSFIDYGVAMAMHKDNKHNEAQPFESSSAQQLGMFKTQIAPRNVSNTTYVDIVEATSSDDTELW